MVFNSPEELGDRYNTVNKKSALYVGLVTEKLKLLTTFWL